MTTEVINQTDLSRITSKVSIIETKSDSKRMCAICKNKTAALVINNVNLCTSEYCQTMFNFIHLTTNDRLIIRQALTAAINYYQEKSKAWKKPGKRKSAKEWLKLIQDYQATFDVYGIYASDHKNITNSDYQELTDRIQQLAKENIKLRKENKQLKSENNSFWKQKRIISALRKDKRRLERTISQKLG